MNETNKRILSGVLAAAMAVSLAACGSAGTKPEETTAIELQAPMEGNVPDGAGYYNEDLLLTLPSDMANLVTVDLSKDDPDGVLFSVSEKASVEAGVADGHDRSWGDGWLFGIRRVDADTLHQMLCWDMSGAEVFAADGDGRYYIYTHPTDVRFYRQGDAYQSDSAGWEQWRALNEWATDNVRGVFVADNQLTPFTRGNSMIEMYLARAAYDEDTNYNILTFTSDLAPNGVDAAPYVERLMSCSSMSKADASETPAGEFIVLDFPDDGVRIDFFCAEGMENYVRRMDGNGEQLVKLGYADGTKASAVVREWADALEAASVHAVD